MFSHIKPYREEYFSALSDIDNYRVNIERRQVIEGYFEVRNTPKVHVINNVFDPFMYGSGVLFLLLIVVCMIFQLNGPWVNTAGIFLLLALVFGVVNLVATACSGSYRHETTGINKIIQDYNRFPDEPVLQQALLNALDDLEETLKADLAQGVMTREEVIAARTNKERAKVVKKYI